MAPRLWGARTTTSSGPTPPAPADAQGRLGASASPGIGGTDSVGGDAEGSALHTAWGGRCRFWSSSPKDRLLNGPLRATSSTTALGPAGPIDAHAWTRRCGPVPSPAIPHPCVRPPPRVQPNSSPPHPLPRPSVHALPPRRCREPRTSRPPRRRGPGRSVGCVGPQPGALHADGGELARPCRQPLLPLHVRPAPGPAETPHPPPLSSICSDPATVSRDGCSWTSCTQGPARRPPPPSAWTHTTANAPRLSAAAGETPMTHQTSIGPIPNVTLDLFRVPYCIQLPRM